MVNTEVIVALIGAAGVLAGAAVTAFFLKGKTKAEIDNLIAAAYKMVTESVNNIVPPLNKRIDDLEKDVSDLRCELDGNKDKFNIWLKGIKKLIKQIVSLGHEPEWVPDELKEKKEEKDN